MRDLRGKLIGLALCAAIFVLGAGAASAQAAFDDPLFVFSAPKTGEAGAVPPGSGFEGPCGLTVDRAGSFYVSDYYHDAVDIFNSTPSYASQLANEDPLDGPCALATDTTNKLYVNNFHRNVVAFTPSLTGFGAATVVDSGHSTGVAVDTGTNNVYVNDGTYVAAYNSSGASLFQLGLDPLADYYGLAVSRYIQTSGFVYTPDAASDTVKVYNPAVSKVTPVATISGPTGGFTSLRDSAVAVDRTNGDVYIADRLSSPYAEHPEAAIDIFDFTGTYKGRLKYNVVDGGPVGLAIDATPSPTQGRVYVTSGNTNQASVYIYPPDAVTNVEEPAVFSLSVNAEGSGAGSVTSKVAGINCQGSCEADLLAAGEVPLTATPDQGSTFEGWSGGGCEGTGTCTVKMDEATSVSAEFSAPPGEAAQTPSAAGAPAPAVSALPAPAASRQHRAHHRHHHRAHRRHRAGQHR